MCGKKILGCVADDFTGASDAASFLAAGGSNVILLSGIPASEYVLPSHITAAVIALKSRTEDRKTAVADSLKAVQWLKSQGAEQIYIKYCSTFDSSPEGNIGPVCDGVMELLNERYTLLCPSLTVNKRTVEKGHLYVAGVPLHKTHMAYHPLTPMWDSDISILMKEQSKYPCYILEREVMKKGRAVVENYISETAGVGEHFYLIPDFTNEDDAELISSLFGNNQLLTGGSGLMEYLAASYGSKAEAEDIAIKEGRALIVVGSCSAATEKQVQYYKNQGEYSLMLEPDKLLSGAQSLDQILDILENCKEKVIMLYAAPIAENGSKKADEKAAAILEKTMALAGRKAVTSGYTKVIAAGGETSGAVLKKLGFSQYRISKSVAPGVPILMPEEAPGLGIVLKSGNFGQEDFFIKALHMLGGNYE
jgi:uncharacterized protein YgbK (DUF1537 family)